MFTRIVVPLLFAGLPFTASVWAAEAPMADAPPVREKPLKTGEKAPALKLPLYGADELIDESLDLAKVFAEGPTVLVVLRGYPGYQCPACSRQVAGFVGAAKKFQQAGVRVVLVYPGAVANLPERAGEFLQHKPLPEPLTMVLDPDYRLTGVYGLRWDAPNETAYPSTFIIGKDRKVQFAEVSKSHGGRVSADAVLKRLEMSN